MIVHSSHRIEDLIGALAEVVAQPCGDARDRPLCPEMIAVQGKGMERWISMELSRRLGVWANPAFPFPRSLIEQAFTAVLGSAEEGPARFEPEAMTWAVAGLLPSLLEHEAFEPLQRFLSQDSTGIRRIQLASRIAQTLDHYVVYRPEMIALWERTAAPKDWQAILWKQLVEHAGPHHLAARAADFLSSVTESKDPLDGFPLRVSLFGISTLPPLYLEVLSALSGRVDLHLFVLRCTRDPLLESPRANPLWVSMGEVGRQFHQVLAAHPISLQSYPSNSPQSRPSSSPQGRPSMEAERRAPTILQAVQTAVLEGEGEKRSFEARPEDRSIQVHACHGPMREMEVLHDQLQALFEADPTLEPRHVIVMTPDVEKYAPFIESAFASKTGSETNGPGFGYRLADRRVGASYEVVDALWALLDALSGRVTASAVVDLLMIDRIRRRFRIDAGDLEVLLEWIRDAGIRWGVDAAHREEVGQPSLRQNTWQHGMDRLLLSLAMPPDGRILFAGVRPVLGVEPGRSELLGRFVEFCDALFGFREAVSGLHNLGVWGDEIARLVEQMVDTADDGAQQQARVRDALMVLSKHARDAGFDEAISLASLREELERQLERGVESHRFLTGGVTFCELVPMRSIPFRVVALVGMNDDAFPRTRVPLGFDYVAKNPRPGDRTSRDDDRYLFLEALVSARDQLIVTYVGRSLRDGSLRAPSVVVEELIDEVLRLAGASDREASRARLVVEHPLHAFSPRYFDGSAATLFSYSKADCAGAEALVAAREERGGGACGRAWVPAPVSLREDGANAVELTDLARFFEHPTRAFLQRRFGLYLRDEVESLEDREPLELDSLDRWVHSDALLRGQLAGLTPGAAAAHVRADGGLPPGVIGDVAESVSLGRVERLLQQVEGARAGGALAPVEVDRSLGRWHLYGLLGDLWPGGRVVYQLSLLPHPREINFWIQHLVLNWLAPEGIPRKSFLVARKGEDAEVRVLPPCDDPEPMLLELLELYAQGQTLPLPLLRVTSLRQAIDGEKWGYRDEASKSASASWTGYAGGPPAGRDDPYLAQAFRDVDPLDPRAPIPGPRFADLARRVYEPYLREVEDLK